MTSTSIDGDQIIEEVRDALAGISSNMLPDNTILQEHDRWVEPYLDANTDDATVDQTAFDNAAIAYTAERSYKAIPMKSTISGGGLTANMAVSQYIEELEARTAQALSRISVTPPSSGPAPIATRTDGMFDELR